MAVLTQLIGFDQLDQVSLPDNSQQVAQLSEVSTHIEIASVLDPALVGDIHGSGVARLMIGMNWNVVGFPLIAE